MQSIYDLILAELEATGGHPLSRASLESRLPKEYWGEPFKEALGHLLTEGKLKYTSKPVDRPIQLGAETVTITLDWVELRKD